MRPSCRVTPGPFRTEGFPHPRSSYRHPSRSTSLDEVSASVRTLLRPRVLPFRAPFRRSRHDHHALPGHPHRRLYRDYGSRGRRRTRPRPVIPRPNPVLLSVFGVGTVRPSPTSHVGQSQSHFPSLRPSGIHLNLVGHLLSYTVVSEQEPRSTLTGNPEGQWNTSYHSGRNLLGSPDVSRRVSTDRSGPSPTGDPRPRGRHAGEPPSCVPLSRVDGGLYVVDEMRSGRDEWQ